MRQAGQADVFILSLCDTIKRLIVDKLHIVGDIFDRGARPDIVLDDLMMHHGVDIQWGNHDILWMGAAVGNPACIATVIRNSIRQQSRVKRQRMQRSLQHRNLQRKQKMQSK